MLSAAYMKAPKSSWISFFTFSDTKNKLEHTVTGGRPFFVASLLFIRMIHRYSYCSLTAWIILEIPQMTSQKRDPIIVGDGHCPNYIWVISLKWNQRFQKAFIWRTAWIQQLMRIWKIKNIRNKIHRKGTKLKMQIHFTEMFTNTYSLKKGAIYRRG